MNYSLIPFQPNGRVSVPPSKSYAHRAIILSALASGKTLIKNVGNSADVLATLACVKNLGAKIDEVANGVVITGIKTAPKTAILDFGESGSTMRFLIPVVASLGVQASFTGRGKLLSRPNAALYSVLEAHGVTVKDNVISGQLQSGEYEIDASISSQYVSGLLLALSALEQKSKIILKGKTVSQDYILMTLDLLGTFNIQYSLDQNCITVGGGLKSPSEISVEGDWSSAAFPLCFGCINGKVTVDGVSLLSKQGDKRIVEILKEVGAKVSVTQNTVTVEKGTIKSVTVDVEGIPDLAPVLASVLAYADGKSVLRNVDRLKIKESDRLNAIIENLSRANVVCEYKDNALIIHGGQPKGASFLGFNDHRMVMSACVLSSNAVGESSVSDYQAVDKSYPEFFEHYKILKGECDVSL